MSNWQKVRLGDVCAIKHGYAFKGEDFSDSPTSYILTTPGNFKIGGGFKCDKPKYYNGEIPNGYILQKDDIIVTMTDLSKAGDTLGYSALVPNGCGITYLHNQRVGLVEVISNSVDKMFLYWLLRTRNYQQYIVGGASGSTVKHTSPKFIQNYTFYLPSLKEQERIARILGTLDDKIECNNRINRNLEKQASALFSRWFVDFEFPDSQGKLYRSNGGPFTDSPLGEIPTGWKIGKLGDYCRVKSGYAFKSSWWLDKGVKVIKIKNINSNNTLNLDDCSFVAEDKINVAKDFKVIDSDLLIAMTGATIGKFAIVCSNNEILLVNQRVGKFFLGDNPNKKLPFIYNVLKQDKVSDAIINKGQGSAQPNISPNDIESIEFAYPDSNLIDLYNEKCFHIFKLIVDNQKENRTLSELRDSLLPKLMNNELSLDELSL